MGMVLNVFAVSKRQLQKMSKRVILCQNKCNIILNMLQPGKCQINVDSPMSKPYIESTFCVGLAYRE